MDTLASDPNMPKAGEVVADRYRVERTLGEGGFAVVYKATDVRTGATVAVKVLDPLMSRRSSNIARFRREIELVARLTHPNTIRVTDCGETSQGCLFLVMEYLQGSSLDDVLRSELALSPARVAHIVRQVLKSLAEAHAAGVVHRDLKPANIFLAQLAGEADYVKVLDFGIAKALGDDDAKLTKSGEIPCSPHYVAPERVSRNEANATSDIYSLGVMMVELLEGAPPYKQDSLMALVLAHANMDEPVPMAPDTRDGPLGSVICKATEKHVSNRYQSAIEMLRGLDGIAADLRGAGATKPSNLNDQPGQANATRMVAGGAKTNIAVTGPELGSVTDTATVLNRAFSKRPLYVGTGLVAAAALIVGLALWLAVTSASGRSAVPEVGAPPAVVSPALPPEPHTNALTPDAEPDVGGELQSVAFPATPAFESTGQAVTIASTILRAAWIESAGLSGVSAARATPSVDLDVSERSDDEGVRRRERPNRTASPPVTAPDVGGGAVEPPSVAEPVAVPEVAPPGAEPAGDDNWGLGLNPQ